MGKIKKNNYYLEMIKYHFFKIIFTLLGDKNVQKIKYRIIFGRKLDFNNPDTLNAKIHWLKLNCREDFHTVVADKYAARKWLADRFGDQYLVPLLYYTDNYRTVRPENIPHEPCVIKSNNGCGSYHIIRDFSTLTDEDWDNIRNDCRIWMAKNHYYRGQEWQYKNMKPLIIVEKLLLTKDGKIPNDYKLNFFNGKLEFVYCSVDREGGDYRNLYDANWKPLNFFWVGKRKLRPDLRGPEIDPPATFEKMKEIGSEIAKLFKYVRVDFYDVDGVLYYGEITLHHGSGADQFFPDKYDFIYGSKLNLGNND